MLSRQVKLLLNSVEIVKTNNKFKQIRNAWHFRFESALVSTAQWFRLGGGVAHYLIWRYVNGEKSQNLISNFLLQLIFTAAPIR